jgi:hypothetical protein
MAIYRLLYDNFFFHFPYIERDRLETTSLMSMIPKGYKMNGIGIWMEYNEIEPL